LPLSRFSDFLTRWKRRILDLKLIMQISFLPWAALAKTAHFGPIAIWPYWREREQRIPDQALRVYLDRYFSSYVDHRGRPVDTICVCTFGQVEDCRAMNRDDALLRYAIDSLTYVAIMPDMLAGVLSDNDSIVPANAERYQLITQSFDLARNDVAVNSGSVLQGGYTIGEITFVQPWSLGGAGFQHPDWSVLKALAALWEARSAGFLPRIARALEWFRLAHLDLDGVDWRARVVMMATAFEIILQIPFTNQKKQAILDAVDKFPGKSTLRIESRTIGKKNDVVLTASARAWWVYDFYELRNKIAHGEVVAPAELASPFPKRQWLTQLIGADLVFRECLTWLLFEAQFLGENVRASVADWSQIGGQTADDPTALTETIALCMLGIEDVYKTLDWLANHAS
jgi:hypothetical protein